MEKIRLVDVCNPKQWKTIPTGELLKEGYPVYGANGVIGYYSEYNHENPVVVITCRGATCGSINLTVPKAYVTGNAMCLDNVRNDIELEYLYYFLKHYDFKYVISGSAQPQITRQGLEKVYISYCSRDQQVQIVEKLKKVESIIRIRSEEIQKLDSLIKARFVEMFVSKNYPREDLDSLSYGKGEYGAQSASMEYDPSRPRYVRITDINDDGSLNEDYVCSSNTDDDETYKLTYGDFCFARMGATVGKTYAYKSGNQIFAGYLIRYKLRLDRVIPEYLYEFTRLDEYWKWVLINQSGAAQPGINAKKYGSLLIPIAPLEEQQKFAEFVKQVDKSKTAVQKSLDKTQMLFDSLMQEYFG